MSAGFVEYFRVSATAPRTSSAGDYTWNDNGELIRISSPRQTRSYSYSDTGRLTGVHTTAANLDIRIPYATDPAGNRLPDPELHPDSTLSMWPDNRIAPRKKFGVPLTVPELVKQKIAGAPPGFRFCD
nr:RHS repeat protein [Escherichia coli]